MKNDIKRRSFLASFAALGSVSSIGANPARGIAATESNAAALKITDVQMLQLTGKDKQKSLYLKLVAGQGHEGLYGPIDEDAAVFVDRFFRRRLIGQNGLEGEAFWDRMFRINRHSRGSHYLMGHRRALLQSLGRSQFPQSGRHQCGASRSGMVWRRERAREDLHAGVRARRTRDPTRPQSARGHARRGQPACGSVPFGRVLDKEDAGRLLLLRKTRSPTCTRSA